MKRSEFRKTPNGRQLSTNSRLFQDALARAHYNGREGMVAMKGASYAIVRDVLTPLGHIALEQDGSVECPRCGRSGSHRLDVGAESTVLVLVGKVFQEECKLE